MTIAAANENAPQNPKPRRKYYTKLTRNPTRDPFAHLSPGEERLLAAVASGLTTRAAAKANGVTLGTAHTYLKRVYARLGVTSRLQAVLAYQERRTCTHPAHTKLLDELASKLYRRATKLVDQANLEQDPLDVQLPPNACEMLLTRAAQLAVNTARERAEQVA